MLKQKYGQCKQVKHQSEIKEGDIIAYICEHKQSEVRAEVLGLLEPVVENVIICRRLDEEMADLVDFNKVPVFLVSKSFMESLEPKCECGAAFTSNPKYHFTYCPMSGE